MASHAANKTTKGRGARPTGPHQRTDAGEQDDRVEVGAWSAPPPAPAEQEAPATLIHEPAHEIVREASPEVLLVCNPAAGGRWKDLARILDSDPAQDVRRVVTDSLSDVGQSLIEMSRRAKLVCVYGGDGTIQRLLDSLALEAQNGHTRLPPLAFIGGGTMNLAARWCGLRGAPHRNFADVMRRYRRGELATRRLPLLRVRNGDEVHYGMTLGLGPLVRIVNEYERGGKGKLAALATGVRTIAAVWHRSGPMAPVVEHMEAEITLDEDTLPFHTWSALFCSVLDSINPTIKPFARARKQDNFHAIAYAVSPRQFTLALPLLWRGYLPIDREALKRPVAAWRQTMLAYFGRDVLPSDPRYVNTTIKDFRIDSKEPFYTLDGEILPLRDPVLEAELGPEIEVAVSPTADLDPATRVAASLLRWLPQRERAH